MLGDSVEIREGGREGAGKGRGGRRLKAIVGMVTFEKACFLHGSLQNAAWVWED